MDNLNVMDKQFNELCREEDRFQALFNSITDALLVHWVETDQTRGTFIETNDVACHLLGYTREELLDMTPSDIDAPDSGVDVASITQKLEFGKNVLFEQTHITKEGRRIRVEINSRVFIFNGTPAVISLVRDITERRMMEARMTKLNECLLSFGANPVDNINLLVNLCGEQLAATCCLYNRLTDGLLCSMGQWNTPPDFLAEDAPEGHICYDIIRDSISDVKIIRNLQQTQYAKTDLNVLQYGLKTYMGKVVSFEGIPIGSLCVVYQTDCTFTDKDKEFLEIVASAIGVEEKRKEAEKKMKELATAVEQSSDWILITDRDGKIEYANNAVERISGFKREEILNKTPRIFKSGKYDNKFYKKMWNTILSGQTFSGILTNKGKGGKPFEIYHTVTPIRDDNGKIARFVATSKDITALRLMEERINFLANYDDLTKLPNRTLFTDRLIQAVSRAEYNEKSTAVLFIDIDRFHLINDALGLNVGDACLKEIAKRLSIVVREGDIVARFGSDEFAVALIDVNRSEDVILIIEDIREVLSVPIGANEEETVLNFSIGISIYRDDSADIGTIMQNADIACQKAKEQGGNSYQFFTPDMNERASEFILMERNLFNAIKNDEFVLHYQPYFDIHTRRMVGMEALIRWRSGDKGLVPPGSFIPVLEKTGMIIEVGEWVLRTAIRQIKEWQNQGYPVVPVSVNLSLVQFRQKKLVATIKDLLEEYALAPSLLVLEITESAFMEDIEFTKSMLEELKDIGVSISIDDFGTGYSSLSYLKRIPVDNLKIDMSFIREIAMDSDTASIVSAIVTMANALNLKTIAEGIETEEQLRILQVLNCNTGQGFHFSKPLPREHFEKLLLREF